MKTVIECYGEEYEFQGQAEVVGEKTVMISDTRQITKVKIVESKIKKNVSSKNGKGARAEYKTTVYISEKDIKKFYGISDASLFNEVNIGVIMSRLYKTVKVSFGTNRILIPCE